MKMTLLKNSIKPVLMASTLALVSANIVAEELPEKRLNSIKRDIKVMTNIIRTTLSDNLGHKVGQLNGIYMAKQGMLFTVSSNRSFSFHFSDHGFSGAPIAPLAPRAPKAPVPVITADNMDEIEESTMEIVEAAMEMAESQIDIYSDIDWSNYSRRDRDEFKREKKALRNQQRELERQARSLERDVREIERKIRDAEFEQELQDGKKNEAKIASLEKELNKYTDSLSSIVAKIQEKAEALRKKAEQARKKHQAKQEKQLLAMEQAISQTVCDFGAGLRSLPKGEHITFNIQGKDNRLYVFDQKSILSCADGKIDAEKLLSRAIKYSL